MDKIYKRNLMNELLIDFVMFNKIYVEKLLKKFYTDKIIKIHKQKIDRTKIYVDDIKKETDKILYNLTEEQWIEFDNKRIKDKQINNKIGELHEYLITNYVNFVRADKNTKVDIMKKDNSIFIELKNKFNTLNSAGKEQTINNLKQVKTMYPNSLCILGIINGKTYKKKINENPELWEYSNEELFNLIFEDKNYYNVINKTIKSCLKDWVKN